MQFGIDAPGPYLSFEGGRWVGRWYVKDVNFGYSKAEVESLVTAALNDPDGWGDAGVDFVMSAPMDSAISFQCLETITYGGQNTIGLCTHESDGTAHIEIEYNWMTSHAVINHEAAHGYFFAEHSPEGADSIEEPMVDDPQEDPSALDIAQVIAWLGPDPPEPPPEPTRYFFPGGLETYITPWYIPAGARARMTATIRDPAPAIIRPVYAESHEQMLSGDRRILCRGIGTDQGGWQHTEWQDTPVEGEVFVALIVEVEAGASIDELGIAHAEIQLSGTGDASARQIMN